MIDINIFSKYEVSYKCKYSYINEYGDFSDGEDSWVKNLDGYEFIEFLCRFLKDRDFMRLLVKDNFIYIEELDPNSGEGGDYTIEFKEIDEEYK